LQRSGLQEFVASIRWRRLRRALGVAGSVASLLIHEKSLPPEPRFDNPVARISSMRAAHGCMSSHRRFHRYNSSKKTVAARRLRRRKNESAIF
jgi:hypothetical protein